MKHPVSPVVYNGVMLRREFITLSLFARRRKSRPKAKPLPPSQTPNAVERAQLLAHFHDCQIRTALDCRFLGLWSAEELEAEMAAREVRRRTMRAS